MLYPGVIIIIIDHSRLYSAILRSVLVYAGSFQCSHNPPNSVTDYRRFNVCIIYDQLHVHTPEGPRSPILIHLVFHK